MEERIYRDFKNFGLPQTVLRALAVVFGLCVFSQAVADDTEKLRRIFEEAKDGYVNIPAGIYRIGGGGAIRISSGTTVIAEGAVFVFPEKLPEKARVVMFEGTDIKNFKWTGGTFRGNVFDPESAENPWCWHQKRNPPAPPTYPAVPHGAICCWQRHSRGLYRSPAGIWGRSAAAEHDTCGMLPPGSL